ncbi:MAG TPA: hypothetical protein DCM28_17515, partial [Phycisphaerales bacterium]|nr:hypothetical protein [Phycisphaerales bacterium]
MSVLENTKTTGSNLMATSFQCTLVTPERQLVDQPVTYASIPAWDGLMGVEPQRAPLMIKLGAGAL